MKFRRDTIVSNGERIPVEVAIPTPYRQESYGENMTGQPSRLPTSVKQAIAKSGTVKKTVPPTNPQEGKNMAADTKTAPKTDPKTDPKTGSTGSNGAVDPNATLNAKTSVDTAAEEDFVTEAPVTPPAKSNTPETPAVATPDQMVYYANQPVYIYGCGRDEKGRPFATLRASQFRAPTEEEKTAEKVYPIQWENPHTAIVPTEGSANTRVLVSNTAYDWLVEKFVPAIKAFQARKLEGKFFRYGAAVVRGRGPNAYTFNEWAVLESANPPKQKRGRKANAAPAKEESFGIA